MLVESAGAATGPATAARWAARIGAFCGSSRCEARPAEPRAEGVLAFMWWSSMPAFWRARRAMGWAPRRLSEASTVASLQQNESEPVPLDCVGGARESDPE